MNFDFDPDAADRDGSPRKLLSPAFWLMIALSAACVLAGAAVGLAPALLRGGHSQPASHGTAPPRLGSPPPAG